MKTCAITNTCWHHTARMQGRWPRFHHGAAASTQSTAILPEARMTSTINPQSLPQADILARMPVPRYITFRNHIELVRVEYCRRRASLLRLQHHMRTASATIISRFGALPWPPSSSQNSCRLICAALFLSGDSKMRRHLISAYRW